MKIKTKILNILRYILFKNSLFEWIIIHLPSMIVNNFFLHKLIPNYYQYPKNTIRNATINGINFQLDISDYMQWALYYRITIEPRNILYEKSKNKKHILDIGANIGETSLHFAKNNPDSKVYAFEPMPDTFIKLNHNVLLNNFTNIEIYNFGMGNSEGKFYMSIPANNNIAGAKVDLNISEGYNIYITTVDNFVFFKRKLTSVDFIKIDVEGFEYNVLLGSINTIKSFKPTLFIEINDNNLKQQNTTAKTVIQFLEKFYPKIYRADTGEFINSDYNFENKHFDILCEHD
jgi:FkbM family methyltransferase